MSISTMWPEASALGNRTAMLVAFAAGSLLTLIFAPFHYFPLVWVSLPMFVAVLFAATTSRQAVLRAFFFGYGFFMAGTWWIANALLVDAAQFGWMLPFSVLGLSAVMALWFALFGYLVHRLNSPSYGINLLRFALLWVGMEYLRSIGPFGFPWNLAGYSALVSLELSQAASLIGTFGLSLLVILVGLIPCFLLRCRRRVGRTVAIGLLMAVMGLTSYGQMRLVKPSAATALTVRIAQPNIPQEIKGTQAGRERSIDILRAMNDASALTPADVTIWPETAYPFTVRGQESAFMMPRHGLLITGAVRAEMAEAGPRIFNSVLAMNPQGHVLMAYDKYQLVPFGEFVPLRSVLPLDKITPGSLDFSRGEGPRTVALDGVPPFSPLVCYEIVFPWLATARERPAWLINVTNDGWYGVTPGPYQHFEMSRMRAIEQGLPLVRAANSGVTALFDPLGRIVQSLPLHSSGIIEAKLPQALPPTLYAGYGEWPVILMLIFLWEASVARLRHKI